MLFRVNPTKQLRPSLLEGFRSFPSMLGISKPESNQVAPALGNVSLPNARIESIANLLLLYVISERIPRMEDG